MAQIVFRRVQLRVRIRPEIPSVYGKRWIHIHYLGSHCVYYNPVIGGIGPYMRRSVATFFDLNQSVLYTLVIFVASPV